MKEKQTPWNKNMYNKLTDKVYIEADTQINPVWVGKQKK